MKKNTIVYVLILILAIALTGSITYIVMSRNNNNEIANNKDSLSDNEIRNYLNIVPFLNGSLPDEDYNDAYYGSKVTIDNIDKEMLIFTALNHVDYYQFKSEQDKYKITNHDGYNGYTADWYIHVSNVSNYLKNNYQYNNTNWKDIKAVGGGYLYENDFYMMVHGAGSMSYFKKTYSYNYSIDDDNNLVILEDALFIAESYGETNKYLVYENSSDMHQEENVVEVAYNLYYDNIEDFIENIKLESNPTKFKHTYKKNDIGYYWYSTEVVNERKNEEKDLVSEASILKLANNEKLEINTDFKNITGITTYDDNNQLTVIDGKLYVTNGNKKSKVINFDEKVIQIEDSGNNGACAAVGSDILILTNNGDLYGLMKDNIKSLDEYIEMIENGLKSGKVELELKKLNYNNLKVLAFTTTYGDGRGCCCGPGTSYVYTSDNKFRKYFDFDTVIDKLIIDSVGSAMLFFNIKNDTNYGFVVYSDNTISVEPYGTNVKNKNNTNLILNDYYYDEERKTIYVIDENNDVYIKEPAEDLDDYEIDNIKLYKNSKVKNINISGNRVTITLEDGEILSFNCVRSFTKGNWHQGAWHTR